MDAIDKKRMSEKGEVNARDSRFFSREIKMKMIMSLIIFLMIGLPFSSSSALASLHTVTIYGSDNVDGFRSMRDSTVVVANVSKAGLEVLPSQIKVKQILPSPGDSRSFTKCTDMGRSIYRCVFEDSEKTLMPGEFIYQVSFSSETKQVSMIVDTEAPKVAIDEIDVDGKDVFVYFQVNESATETSSNCSGIKDIVITDGAREVYKQQDAYQRLELMRDDPCEAAFEASYEWEVSGERTLCIEVTDRVGIKSEECKTFNIDSEGPKIKDRLDIFDVDGNDVVYASGRQLRVFVTAYIEEDNLSEVRGNFSSFVSNEREKDSYSNLVADSCISTTPGTYDCTWDISLRPPEGKALSPTITAEDQSGNDAERKITYPIHIDTESPELEMIGSEFCEPGDSRCYVGPGEDKLFFARIKENGAGLSASNIYFDLSAVGGSSMAQADDCFEGDGIWTCVKNQTVDEDDIQSGVLEIRVLSSSADRVGNRITIPDEAYFPIIYDNTPPTIKESLVRATTASMEYPRPFVVKGDDVSVRLKVTDEGSGVNEKTVNFDKWFLNIGEKGQLAPTRCEFIRKLEEGSSPFGGGLPIPTNEFECEWQVGNIDPPDFYLCYQLSDRAGNEVEECKDFDLKYSKSGSGVSEDALSVTPVPCAGNSFFQPRSSAVTQGDDGNYYADCTPMNQIPGDIIIHRTHLDKEVVEQPLYLEVPFYISPVVSSHILGDSEYSLAGDMNIIDAASNFQERVYGSSVRIVDFELTSCESDLFNDSLDVINEQSFYLPPEWTRAYKNFLIELDVGKVNTEQLNKDAKGVSNFGELTELSEDHFKRFDITCNVSIKLADETHVYQDYYQTTTSLPIKLFGKAGESPGQLPAGKIEEYKDKIKKYDKWIKNLEWMVKYTSDICMLYNSLMQVASTVYAALSVVSVVTCTIVCQVPPSSGACPASAVPAGLAKTVSDTLSEIYNFGYGPLNLRNVCNLALCNGINVAGATLGLAVGFLDESKYDNDEGMDGKREGFGLVSSLIPDNWIPDKESSEAGNLAAKKMLDSYANNPSDIIGDDFFSEDTLSGLEAINSQEYSQFLADPRMNFWSAILSWPPCITGIIYYMSKMKEAYFYAMKCEAGKQVRSLYDEGSASNIDCDAIPKAYECIFQGGSMRGLRAWLEMIVRVSPLAVVMTAVYQGAALIANKLTKWFCTGSLKATEKCITASGPKTVGCGVIAVMGAIQAYNDMMVSIDGLKSSWASTKEMVGGDEGGSGTEGSSGSDDSGDEDSSGDQDGLGF